MILRDLGLGHEVHQGSGFLKPGFVGGGVQYLSCTGVQTRISLRRRKSFTAVLPHPVFVGLCEHQVTEGEGGREVADMQSGNFSRGEDEWSELRKCEHEKNSP
jgi:hypothetical protein